MIVYPGKSNASSGRQSARNSLVPLLPFHLGVHSPSQSPSECFKILLSSTSVLSAPILRVSSRLHFSALIYNKPDFFFSRVTSSSRSRLVIVCTLVYRIFYYLTRHAVSPNTLFFTPTRPAEVEGSQSTQAGRRKPGQIGTPGERCYSKYKEVPNLGVPKTGFVKCDETHQAQQMPYVT